MNTYTNAIHPRKEGYRTACNDLIHNTAIVTIIVVLVAMIAMAVYIANRPAVAAENGLAAPYSNALEMQYARPWLAQAERLIVVTGNAQEQIPLRCSRSMEILYACKSGYRLPV